VPPTFGNPTVNFHGERRATPPCLDDRSGRGPGPQKATSHEAKLAYQPCPDGEYVRPGARAA